VSTLYGREGGGGGAPATIPYRKVRAAACALSGARASRALATAAGAPGSLPRRGARPPLPRCAFVRKTAPSAFDRNTTLSAFDRNTTPSTFVRNPPDPTARRAAPRRPLQRGCRRRGRARPRRDENQELGEHSVAVRDRDFPCARPGARLSFRGSSGFGETTQAGCTSTARAPPQPTPRRPREI